MPSSWTQNYYHAVFSTKARAEIITPALEERLHPFIGGVVRDLGGAALAVNGMPDHVHVLAHYPADLAHSDLLRHMKGRSSKWVHETFRDLAHFQWQEGYGGFTVSRSMLDAVVHYIHNQKEHHRRRTFREEFLELLRLHGVACDEHQAFS